MVYRNWKKKCRLVFVVPQLQKNPFFLSLEREKRYVVSARIELATFCVFNTGCKADVITTTLRNPAEQGNRILIIRIIQMPS